VDLSVVSAATDVILGFGDPPTELVDLNFQSGPDPSLVRRLLLYNALLHQRYDAPVHSLLILLRPAADGPHLTGRLRYRGQGRRGRTDFRYEVVRLWEVPVRLLLRAGLGVLPLAVLGRLPAGIRAAQGLADVVDQVHRRADRELTQAQAHQLLTAAFVLTGLRVARDDLLRLYEGVRGMRESSGYQYILEEGRIEALREMLLAQGRERFGAPDATIQAALSGLNDLERLRRMGIRMLRVNSWQELLRTR
jgi:predicted transposase YdaD